MASLTILGSEYARKTERWNFRKGNATFDYGLHEMGIGKITSLYKDNRDVNNVC